MSDVVDVHLPGPADIGPVTSPPADLPSARDGLHRLAAYVVAPARYRVTERFGLRWVPGGVGTPAFGDGRQVRLVSDQLEVVDADGLRSAPITSIAAAAEHLGEPVDGDTAAEHDTPALGNLDIPLGVRGEHLDWLSNWWGIGVRSLTQVVGEAASVDPGEVQLWPGHFDVGVEIGDEARRASYGASPGDAANPEPYLYVSLWWPDRLELEPDAWSAEAFTGAVLPASDLEGVADPVAAAAAFYRSARDRLVGSSLKAAPA